MTAFYFNINFFFQEIHYKMTHIQKQSHILPEANPERLTHISKSVSRIMQTVTRIIRFLTRIV